MKCPNCSGTLYYDIKGGQLKCKHCSSVFSVDDYDKDNTAKLSSMEESKVYVCKNCGAAIISNDDEAVLYCNYCGSEQLLEGVLEDVNEPKKIIPFKITKSQCKSLYKKELKGKLFVPKEFKDPAFIDRFRPFYIPYWMYNVKFRDDEFEMDGVKRYTRGDYDYIEDYKVKVSIQDKGLYGVPYDASRNFDDTIAEKIAPFRKDGLCDYKEGYLAGMYADVPNVSADTYKEEVLDKATTLAISDLERSVGNIDLKFPNSIKKQREFLDARYQGEEMVYLPVWFLTWRHDERVAYAIVNGQNGNIHIDLPVDLKGFLKYILIGAGGLFVLLSLFLTVTSRFVLWLAALLAYLVGRQYRKELKQIRDRENHVYDKGYLLQDDDDLPMSEKRRNRLRKHNRIDLNNPAVQVVLAISAAFMGMVFFLSAYDILVTQEGAIGICTLTAVLSIISFIRTSAISIYLKNKRSFLFSILTLSTVLLSWFIAVKAPVDDWYYYVSALGCLIAATLMCVDLLSRFNELSTRPLPSFYDRKGGNDREKDI